MPQNPLLFISVEGLDVTIYWLHLLVRQLSIFPLGKGKETSTYGQKSSCTQALVYFSKLQA